jgi:hypothetical protein
MMAGAACSEDDDDLNGVLGVFVGFNEEQRLVDFEQDLNAPVGLVVTMADSRSSDAMVSSVWGQFTAPDAYLPSLSDRRGGRRFRPDRVRAGWHGADCGRARSDR